jgi:carbon monoxide dehydrogenase subunit G
LAPAIESTSEFQINADLGKCWEFFSALLNIGSCIPGCESIVQIDERTAVLRIKVAVGYVSKTFELRAKFEELTPRSHIVFSGLGHDAEMEGVVDLQPTDEQRAVEIRYKIKIRPNSTLGRTAVSLIGKDLVRRQADEFALCVKSKLERASLV